MSLDLESAPRGDPAARTLVSAEASGDALFRALFAQSLDAIVIADDEARYVEANPAACALFGLTREEILVRRVPDVAPPSLKDRAEEAWKGFRAAGSQKGEFELARPDGSVRIVEFSAKADVVPGRHLSILRDVTEGRALQREIRAELQERAENDRTREVFIGALGHDLRNPLAAIMINAEIVRRSALGDPLAEPFERIVGSANRMARMISELLDFTRVRQGTLLLDRRPADVRQITAKVLDELQTIHPGEIHADLSPVLAAVDSDRFAQVVSNLAANAVRHGDGRGVRVRLRQEADGLALEVHNTGSLIPLDAREGIFDPFRRSFPHAVREGLGLGLFIVRHIVAAHGGDVQVDSDEATGTTFRVRIPAASNERRPAP